MFASLIEPHLNARVGVGFTDRLDGASTGALGSFNLGRSDLDDLASLRANMSGLRAHLGVGEVAAVHQVHGTRVHLVDTDGRDWGGDAWLGDRLPGAEKLPVADAIVTTKPGVALMIRVADCLPVLLADQRAGVIAAAHAGRVGLLAGVLPATVAAMRKLGADRLRAWIGPHICGACYEVPEQMAAEAAARLPAAAARTSWGTSAIDLGAGAAAQLAGLGVDVRRLDPCTLTSPDLFSHRGDGAGAGRQVGVIWLAGVSQPQLSKVRRTGR